jgi:peptidoglycan/LPS O-acetylase OafA/YrhL
MSSASGSRTSLAASIILVSIGASLLLPVSIFLGLAPLACAAMLVAYLRSKRSFLPLELAGNASYSWYLLHTIIGYKVQGFITTTLGIDDWSAAFAGIVVSFALSFVTFRLIERPMIQAGKWIIALRKDQRERKAMALPSAGSNV